MSKHEDKKEAILLAGMEVMKCQGYNGTSVKDIVDAAGVPKGSFYNYFDSKEQFALDAIDYASNEGRIYIESIMSDVSRRPIERLHAFFAGGIDCACENEFKVGCFLGNMCQEMADVSDVIRCKLDAAMGGNTRLIARAVSEGQKAGDFRTQQDANTIAEFLFNAWEGALMRAKAAKSRAPLDAFIAMLAKVVS